QRILLHLSPQIFEFSLQLGREHCTLSDVADIARAAFVVSQPFFNAVVLPLRARAIVPLIRRGGDLKWRNIFNLRDSMQAVFDDLNFRVQLGLVSQLLKVTATTPAKVRTRRLDALRRRLDNFDNRGEADCSLLSIDLYAQAIAG